MYAVASRIQTSPSLSSRATPAVLVPLLSASPQGFCAPPRNVIFPPVASVLPATNLRRSNNSAPFVRLSIRTILCPSPSLPPSRPSLRYSSPYIGGLSFSIRSVAVVGDGEGGETVERTAGGRGAAVEYPRIHPLPRLYTLLLRSPSSSPLWRCV